ncbi:MAG: hypothetical protein OQJ96_11275 [Flavobacteriales bacterium]|nr:hypothetical protein [Flavobacteriales bacterium]MCW8912537.1 hypothetical protein [Flavobacteriales bacterium]MCW8937553.1 hypothetical protein [Flavobacteriales bacterium]MCW8989187.1 hypothetical protein [Flavobacteriales bacterium]MCW9020872.1 hypothetical protein [Flavobacteriales bacterium]
MKKLKLILGSVLSIVAFTFIMDSCGDPQRSMSGNYEYETECMGVEMDGSQTVKAWGMGRNREDAVEQAKKNGVRDVLFKGITNGRQDCNPKPVIFEVNAQEKYEDYFNAFFADQGAYLEFITGEDGSDMHFSVVQGRKKYADQVTYGVIIRVQRAKLKERMIADKIIK